ncbi:diguanylate cyclase (GGDEF)-like protein [Rhodoligotrophos appendicifer]|uniref:GGDEF domain-containing protein n=1 Tax=Rhodoligotrophos appendicifer TaxID=987056 RepID=UPI0014793F7C|nr:GGDEF domain-containing protein [Rhodoligotrophos appendicifer]
MTEDLMSSMGTALAHDPELTSMLLQSLDTGHVGLCLCDELDLIRYANPAFCGAFFPHYAGDRIPFIDAIAAAIDGKTGIRLENFTLPEFVARVARRRKGSGRRFDFAVDMIDGSWWWVNDFKLSNGWLLAVASEISTIKNEEFLLRSAHDTAVQASRTDYLTGLANRRYGFERAELALIEFRENRLPLSIALVDIDHFKQVNDTYGHDIGDKVLVHCAEIFRSWLGPQDQVSRIGGEEFLLVMPGISASRAERGIGDFLRSTPPLPLGPGKEPLPFTLSAGVATAHDSDTLSDLLHRADVALYAAKAKGRHRVELVRRKQDSVPVV